MVKKLNQMVYTVGDATIVQINYNEVNDVTNHNQTTNNSTTISGGTVTGNQFAAGSTEFKGTINNISPSQSEKLEDLSSSLITALESESANIPDTNVAEILDAINQVRDAATKETVNKLSLNGLLSGINMVMTNIKNISTSTFKIYQQWHSHIASLFV